MPAHLGVFTYAIPCSLVLRQHRPNARPLLDPSLGKMSPWSLSLRSRLSSSCADLVSPDYPGPGDLLVTSIPRYLTCFVTSSKHPLRSLFITSCASHWFTEESPFIQFTSVIVFYFYFSNHYWYLLFTQDSGKI